MNCLLLRYHYMRVGKKLFPYPILNKDINLSTYVNSSFSMSYMHEIDDVYLYLNHVKINLGNDYLLDLHTKGIIKFILIVECSSTIFREHFSLTLESRNIRIPMDVLDEKVQISCFGYATNELKNFNHQSFHEDYQSIGFEIEKHDLMIIDDGYELKLTTKEVEDNQVSSIFVVVQDLSSSSKTMQVILDQRNIRIILSKDAYMQYDMIKKHPGLKYTFFSTLLIPALSYAIEMVKQKGFDESENEYDWLSSVSRSYAIIYKKNMDTEMDSVNSLEVAQLLLDSPIILTINELNRIVIQGDRNENE